jgi:hypothetical protein
VSQQTNYRIEMKDPATVAGKAQRAAIRVLVDEAKREIEVRTPERRGTLRKGVYGEVIDGGESGRVGAKARHAHLVHDGTRAHDIAPRRQDRKAVSFVAGGKRITRRRVSHPGTRANPWVQDAVDETFARLGPLMAQAGAVLEREL